MKSIIIAVRCDYCDATMIQGVRNDVAHDESFLHYGCGKCGFNSVLRIEERIAKRSNREPESERPEFLLEAK